MNERGAISEIKWGSTGDVGKEATKEAGADGFCYLGRNQDSPT